ncbi:MAG: helix-turn-helix domain-containing protein [Acidimicrobiales bacterium]
MIRWVSVLRRGTWPFEGVLTALERGTLPDWRRLAHAIVEQPWGTVAGTVEEALSLELPYGVGNLMRTVIDTARRDRARAERVEVAREIDAIIKRSKLSRAEFTRRIGTSPSRLSTYVAGSVTPSASMVVRMRGVTHLHGGVSAQCRQCAGSMRCQYCEGAAPT